MLTEYLLRQQISPDTDEGTLEPHLCSHILGLDSILVLGGCAQPPYRIQCLSEEDARRLGDGNAELMHLGALCGSSRGVPLLPELIKPTHKLKWL